jgi:23S rRNA pseudouridine2604 synthase
VEKIRLSKLMSQRGICSRREADKWIEQGLVKVDGKIVSVLGTRVDPDSSVRIENAARQQQQKLITVLLNKPVGLVSGQPEDGYSTASSLIVRANHYPKDKIRHRHGASHRNLAPAGRLDIDSQGLLVLTQDGRIARRLIGPDSRIEKEYLVRVTGRTDAISLNRLRHGLKLDNRVLRPARVNEIEPNLLKVILVEGRKRQIRRMCELVGLEATGLKRVRIGRVHLADLPKGQWRYLGQDEKF